jgi:hypothetical protein
MATILIAGYFVIGALASALIWLALIASKRRENKAKQSNHERMKTNLIRKPNTKASRFH